MIKNIVFLCILFLFISWFEYYYILQNGNNGVSGSIGKIGTNGNKGVTGDDGLLQSHKNDIPTNFIYNINSNLTIGKIGPAGKNGLLGPKGTNGPIGFRGPRGPIGQSGNNGPVGLIGPAGPQGLEGPPGKDVEWHLSFIDRNNCSIPIYNEVLGYSSCPENSVMIGLENDYNKYKIKCCNLINDIESQNTKYELIKKGKRSNSDNIYEY